MISIEECREATGLQPQEMMLGVPPSARHQRLLQGYLLNLSKGAVAVRDMILADLHMFVELGARERAADLLIVLRNFLHQHPDALRPVEAKAGEERSDNVVSFPGRRIAEKSSSRPSREANVVAYSKAPWWAQGRRQ